MTETTTTQSDADAIRQQVAREKQEYDWVPYGNDVWADQIELLVEALEDARAFLDAGHNRTQYDPDAGDYDLMGDYETDARYIYPARERWMRGHLDSALAAVRRRGERDE